jgi:hypothetical protein
MNRRIRWGWSFAALSAALVFSAGAAAAPDAVLYEVTENVSMKAEGDRGMVFQSSEAVLMGRLKSGTPLCPTWLVTATGSTDCTLTVRATAKAGDETGIGPVKGTIRIVVQDGNGVDAAEVVVVKASFSGTIDLSQAAQGVPLGSITGQYQASGVKGTVGEPIKDAGNFDGVFRLPFLHGSDTNASYLTTSGPVLVGADELTLGSPAVKLEVALSSTVERNDHYKRNNR